MALKGQGMISQDNVRRVNFGLPPNPKQMEFFKSRKRHTAYGGAKASGKSWAMRTKLAMLGLSTPNLNMLLLRRTLPELRENHIEPLRKLLYGVAEYNESKKVMTFPTGSRIVFGYCDREGDTSRYQGHEYEVIGFEEATLFTQQMYEDLILCNRSSNPNFAPRAYYTCNPGGVGHEWVKRLFIDRHFKATENPDDYLFVPAQVYDNYVMMQRQPEYVRMLENLPEDKKRALLYGDWDAYDGRFFTEFSRRTHVVQPFKIPDHWQKYRAFDYGLDMLACYWAAFDSLGNCYIYKELCEPNLIISRAAQKIIEYTTENDIICTFAPIDMWARNRATGKYQAEMFGDYGVPLTPVKNGREAGWQNVLDWMQPVPDGTGEMKPRLFIFENCKELIRCIPLLQHDDKNPNDVATQPHDITHAPDALRYLLDGRPRPAEIPAQKDEFEPIDFDEQVGNLFDYGL